MLWYGHENAMIMEQSSGHGKPVMLTCVLLYHMRRLGKDWGCRYEARWPLWLFVRWVSSSW